MISYILRLLNITVLPLWTFFLPTVVALGLFLVINYKNLRISIGEMKNRNIWKRFIMRTAGVIIFMALMVTLDGHVMFTNYTNPKVAEFIMVVNNSLFSETHALFISINAILYSVLELLLVPGK